MTANEPLSESKIQPSGISHFALNVNNMEKTENFHTNILGLQVLMLSNTKTEQRHIEVDAENVAIALLKPHELDLETAHKVMTNNEYSHCAFIAPYDRLNSQYRHLERPM